MAMINTGGAVAMWFLAPLKGTTAAGFYWWTWLSIFIVHLIIWGPILLLWPITYLGDA